MTWTGALARSPCAAKATGPIGCRCQSTSGRPSLATAGGAAQGGRAPPAPQRSGRAAPRRCAAVRDRSAAAPPARGDHSRVRPRRSGCAGRGGPPLAGRCGMSEMHTAAAEYLTIRRALGFKLRGHDRLLADFIAFLSDAGACTITTAAAVAWATKPAQAQPVRYAQRLCIISGFANYLHAIDATVQVPPTGLLPYRRWRRTPYLYSQTDIDALLAATDLFPRPLRRATYRGVFGLLAATGMRVGEAIALDDADVDLAAGALVIREAKFGKHRRLPLHPSTVAALRDYVATRDRL